MELRKLDIKDAPLMLEWMHNKDVTLHMNRDFSKLSLEDCENFIKNSLADENNVHFAIVDETDEYLGTISLKNIDNINKNAEFGITIREKAMGKGISSEAMKAIIAYGFEKLGLTSIYWCVSSENARAVRFYDKNGYARAKYEELNVVTDYSQELIDKFIWYCVKREVLQKVFTVTGEIKD